MFIRLVDKDGLKSPILSIHCDEKELLGQIESWKEDLLIWSKRTTLTHTPLGRLEADTCIIDLLRHITSYYLISTPHCEGKITSTLSLVDESYVAGSEILEMKTYE